MRDAILAIAMRVPFLRRARAGFNRYGERRNQLEYLRQLARENGSALVTRRRYVAVRRGEQEIRISRGNYVYTQDLIRDFDYYFDVVEPRREGRRSVVDYSTPAMHTMAADGLPFWFPELAESMQTTALYLDHAGLKPGHVVLDLGAYAGGATYHFSRAVGSAGRVYAFEPDPRSFDCLAKNVELHQLRNVVTERRGVWSHSGRVSFQSEGSMGSAVVEASARSSDTKRDIEVVSLMDYCAEQGIDRIDFVKMDVEGSETAILHGADAFIRRYRPPMIIEVHFVQGVRTDDEVTRILTGHGYRVQVVEQAGLALPLLFAAPLP